MSLSETDQNHRDAMALVESASRSLKTVSWIWGGYATDIHMGRILREHDDIDYLTLNLQRLKSHMAEIFSGHGCQAKDLVNGDLSLKKDNVKVHLGNIEIESVAKWTHNGEKGALFFPVSWLSLDVDEFQGSELHVVAPKLQYALKEQPALLNPHWQIRERDILDKGYLREVLFKRGTDVGTWREMISSSS